MNFCTLLVGPNLNLEDITKPVYNDYIESKSIS